MCPAVKYEVKPLRSRRSKVVLREFGFQVDFRWKRALKNSEFHDSNCLFQLWMGMSLFSSWVPKVRSKPMGCISHPQINGNFRSTGATVQIVQSHILEVSPLT